MQDITKEEEEQLREEFEQRVEMRKKWLLDECRSGGKFLDVSAKKLDDLDALTIALYLHECTSQLKLFHIGANQFTDRGLIDMLTGLQWHEHLQEIYMGNNNFSEIGIEAMIEIVPLFMNLKILSLGNCGVTDDNFIQLCYQLPNLMCLEQLIAPSNQIGDYGRKDCNLIVYFVGLICLSSLLTTDAVPSLRVLHLGDNLLTTQSLKNFFVALQKNRTIKTMYLNDMGLEMPTIKSIADCLRKNKTLQELNLGNTGFSDQAAGYIWSALTKSQLKVLHLWNNHLTDAAVLKLVQLMEENQVALTYLGLQDNPIENSEVIKDLNDILKQNQLIEDLPERLKRIQEQMKQPKDFQKSEQEEEQKEMKQLAEEAELEELEEILAQQEQIILEQEPPAKEEEENEEVNVLQGKLKELRWVGEEQDRRGYQHSRLEEI